VERSLPRAAGVPAADGGRRRRVGGAVTEPPRGRRAGVIGARHNRGVEDLNRLRAEVEQLEVAVRAAEIAQAPALAAVDARYADSARNLVHYVALRQRELRRLQLDLWRRGFPSLGHLEGHALDALASVRDRLDDAAARRGAQVPERAAPRALRWDDAERLLHAHTRALLGERPPHRHVYIMVTAPSAAEVDDGWADRALAAGMNLVRINAAHDDDAGWRHVADTVRRVAARRGVGCRVAVDLPGPKLRTVAIGEGTRVVRWRPARDELGRVVEPCTITLRAASQPVIGGGAQLAVPDEIYRGVAPGDELIVRDARGKRRVIDVVGHGRGELRTTAYVVPGVTVAHRRGGQTLATFAVARADVPAHPFRVALRAGDRLRLLRPRAAPPAGEAWPAVGCTLEAALDAVRPGHRVVVDDGHLHAVVEAVDAAGAVLRVAHVPGIEVKLGGEKGINLPDSELALPLLGDEDERALAFAVTSADLVEASFVRGPDDVHTLHRRLAALGADRLAVVLKIETAGAFAQLPAVLLAAMERYPTGVMIARGDLAIETGFARLAELQEEILWLCEAAHLPVIWATQVLADLARTGQPSRAEVTDAAMAVRAECTMLNKGPYIADAIRVLDDILRRMEQHRYKRHSLYRKLHLELAAPAAAPL
jgi:pyruvate kinase